MKDRRGNFMYETFEEMDVSHPSEVAKVLRKLAPELCKKLDTLTAFQRYIRDEKNLKEIKVHPGREILARLWCGLPLESMRGNIFQSPNFTLHIDRDMSKCEMHLIYKDGKRETIRLY